MWVLGVWSRHNVDCNMESYGLAGNLQQETDSGSALSLSPASLTPRAGGSWRRARVRPSKAVVLECRCASPSPAGVTETHSSIARFMMKPKNLPF